MGHSVLKLGKVLAKWDKLTILNSFLLTAVAIEDEASPTGGEYLLHFL